MRGECMNIGQKIQALRKKNGLNQNQLAQMLGVSLQAVSKWESEISAPSAEHVFGLYQVFGKDLFENGGEAITGNYYENMPSIKEIYKIGRGPSSSHSIGPERACFHLNGMYPSADRYDVYLYGSMAKTGKGHRTDYVIRQALNCKNINIRFDNVTKTEHPNMIKFVVYEGNTVKQHIVKSIGGGDIVFDGEILNRFKPIYCHKSFAEIANYCKNKNIALWEYVSEFENDAFDYLKTVWNTMTASVKKGLADEGLLPGGLNVSKKAKHLLESEHVDESPETKENRLICAYAFAVSEQNASAQTIVTAPTCGASGVLPAVLYYEQQKHNYSDDKIYRALATAGIVGNIIKTNASISGAECGCQAEIGSACAMAAAALGELFGLSIDKIEYAAEIALEHHLGLTCDPVCGLVQIPCIERNAVAAMRAINSVDLASLLWKTRKISFDNIVKTMKETGNDLPSNYRETSEGGLAKNYKN